MPAPRKSPDPAPEDAAAPPAPVHVPVVIVPFDRDDPQTGINTRWDVGAEFVGSQADVDRYLAWPGDQGPLIRLVLKEN